MSQDSGLQALWRHLVANCYYDSEPEGFDSNAPWDFWEFYVFIKKKQLF